MPTGYTAFIEDGKVTTAKEFLHICLRNFGLCWSLRDSDVPMDVPDLEPYLKEGFQKEITYHKKKLDKAKKDLEEFLKLPDEELYSRWAKTAKEKIERYQEHYEEARKKNVDYDKFLKAIQGWQPSEDFKGIKKFAIEQITISKDNSPEYWLNEKAKVAVPSMSDFISNHDKIVADLRSPIDWDIKYHQEEYDRLLKGRDSALDFYHRFKEELKSINE